MLPSASRCIGQRPYDPGDFDDHAHQSALINRMTTTWSPRYTTANLQKVIHPALFPSLDSVLHYQSTIPPSPASCLPFTIHHHHHPSSLLRSEQGEVSRRRCQLFHHRGPIHLTRLPPRLSEQQKGIHGESKPTTLANATAIHLVNNSGGIERVLALYSANIDGTVISPKHHATTNPAIHSWVQHSIPHEYRGWIT
jgi:hypothetical protein